MLKLKIKIKVKKLITNTTVHCAFGVEACIEVIQVVIIHIEMIFER
jgi:hypothetical protein